MHGSCFTGDARPQVRNRVVLEIEEDQSGAVTRWRARRVCSEEQFATLQTAELADRATQQCAVAAQEAAKHTRMMARDVNLPPGLTAGRNQWPEESTTAKESLRWYYEDSYHAENGLWTNDQMFGWLSKGQVGYSPGKLRVRLEDWSGMSKLEELFPGGPATCFKCPPKLPGNINWEYLDIKSIRHGPFSNWQMRQWYEHKMVPPTMMIRPYVMTAGAGNNAPFRSGRGHRSKDEERSRRSKDEG